MKMPLICPSLYWARHSSKEATWNEEEKIFGTCSLKAGWELWLLQLQQPALRQQPACLMDHRELWGCSTPAPSTKPNSSTQLWPQLNFQDLCCALLYLTPGFSHAGAQLLLEMEKQLFTGVRHCWDPPGPIYCSGWAGRVRGSSSHCSGSWGAAVTAQPDALLGSWGWFCQWDNQRETFGNVPPRYSWEKPVLRTSHMSLINTFKYG